MKDLEVEKDEIIQEKSDKIDELTELMKRQEQMLQKLGITLDDVAQQNSIGVCMNWWHILFV
jgi:hypothetical protein